MTSHCTWGSVTTLHDFRGVLGRRPSDTFFWALTISWSQLLARVWSGPYLEPFWYPDWWLTLGICTAFSVGGDSRADSVKTLALPSPTCCHLFSFSPCYFEIYSIDSSEMIGRFPEVLKFNRFRATSHTRLRARDHYYTLIGGKGGAGPSSLLHTTRLRDQRSEHVNARRM